MNFYKLIIYILLVLFIVVMDRFVFKQIPQEQKQYSDFEKILILDAFSDEK